jgi:hypothetical protein
MTRKLNDADRAAVDLMFDRILSGGNGNGNGNSGGGSASDPLVVMSNAVTDERLDAVERILTALDQMPAQEPSPDLVVRTLRRVARHAGTGLAPLSGTTGQFIDPSQPMA